MAQYRIWIHNTVSRNFNESAKYIPKVTEWLAYVSNAQFGENPMQSTIAPVKDSSKISEGNEGISINTIVEAKNREEAIDIAKTFPFLKDESSIEAELV